MDYPLAGKGFLVFGFQLSVFSCRLSVLGAGVGECGDSDGKLGKNA